MYMYMQSGVTVKRLLFTPGETAVAAGTRAAHLAGHWTIFDNMFLILYLYLYLYLYLCLHLQLHLYLYLYE